MSVNRVEMTRRHPPVPFTWGAGDHPCRMARCFFSNSVLRRLSFFAIESQPSLRRYLERRIRRATPLLLIILRSFLSQRRAQANSMPRIASPNGITMMAGPGATIMTIPSRITVAPTTAIAIRRAALYVRCALLLIKGTPEYLVRALRNRK